ncbi:putative spermidine/putrescine transport system ATP-binding protein [Mycetocola sp. BIGb0189]|uniref:ABC transporter ATP-binding protein n=1 Tax=Mycetocola sp. BIGb0189 TaxID=2940604 RepID=UPI00216A2471|nr:ABC transporter ATP-binding protein [Mycetocola sp. BIGb0189]MCS4276559.1 putative spermidine/putrescine transport system ATP-binding protein [Mycetocola sp. BIGb0189]
MTTSSPVLPGIVGTPVSFEAVSLKFGSTLALDEFSLDIAPGEFVALLGPSGSGKTTALRALAGLEAASSGRILVDDGDITGVPTNKRDLGMVFQSYSLFPHLTALENTEYGLRNRRQPKAARRTAAQAGLDLVGLGDLADRYPHELSGGQQQRVALARALVTRPKVLLLDESLSALDAKVRVQLREEIRQLQLRLGITTIFVTHDQEEALSIADRVAVMKDGRIEQVGTPEDLYLRPASAFVAEFVGVTNRIPAENLGDGTVRVLGSVLPVAEVPAGQVAEVSAGHVPAADTSAGGHVAYVRPENLRLVEASLGGADVGAGTSGANAAAHVSGPVAASAAGAGAGSGVTATVVESSFLGSFRHTLVTLPDGSLLRIQHAATEALAIGTEVRVQAVAVTRVVAA